jgi:hypothetical protein
MTLTHITPEQNPTDALVGRIRDEIIAAIATPDLSAVHEVIREAGIRNARRALAEAPDRLAEAQAAFREAQAVEAAAKDRYATALVEAEWELDGRFKTDGNKTYLRLSCEVCHGEGKTERMATPAEVDAGCELGVAYDKCEACDGLGTTRKQMTADERKAYKASEAAKHPPVVTAGLDLRAAEEATAAARDAVGIADRRFSAAKYELQAACAELNALAVGLAAKAA